MCSIDEALKCLASHYQRCYFACDNLKLMALIATSIIFKDLKLGYINRKNLEVLGKSEK